MVSRPKVQGSGSARPPARTSARAARGQEATGRIPPVAHPSAAHEVTEHSAAREAGRRRPATRVTLSDDWRAWIVENAVTGASRDELVEALAAGGVSRRLAAAEVDAILRSPALPGCVRLRRRAERLGLVLRLLRTAAVQAAYPGEVERRPTVSADELYDRYWAACRPVVLTRLLEGWPALGKWTPEYLAERFGDVEVEVVADREGAEAPDRHLDRHRRRMSMSEYVRRVRAAGTTNDLYLVSNNRALELPALAPLLDDLTPPADIFEPTVRPGHASLWFGPAGTRTPLHHDTTNILVCQLYGRKRLTLVSPLSAALVQGADGYYAAEGTLDRLSEEPSAPPVLEVVLSPGEALFLPAGFWHEVTALEPSIHVSLLSFRRRTSLDWYHPGAR